MIALQQDRPRRYDGAKDAADTYCEIRQGMDGVKAIDYAKPIVQCTPMAESPATARVDELDILGGVFKRALSRCAEKHAVAWCLYRIAGESERGVAGEISAGKTTVRNWIESVDRHVEQELSDQGLLRRSLARLDKATIVDVYEEGSGPKHTCGGRVRASVVRLEVEG